jgi:AbrB family looped-hinge helix DNA binding protein
VVIPQAIRRRLGLDPGTKLELEEVDGGVALRPVNRVRVEVGADGLPLLKAGSQAPPLSREDVRRVLEESREWPRR